MGVWIMAKTMGVWIVAKTSESRFKHSIQPSELRMQMSNVRRAGVIFRQLCTLYQLL
jgi:hypothetical protein